MDNFTHALAGLLAAETLLALAARGRSQPSPARGALLFASALSNNVPDFDFVYSGITPGGLGYLLHHRGHTHTLVVGLVLGALVHWPFRRWLLRMELRGAAISRFDKRALLGLCLAGPVLHLALDATNNYGVHPFWPLYSGWFYGDSVFIVEPWLWVVSLPALCVSARTRAGRWTFGLLGAIALFAANSFSELPWALFGALCCATGLLLWLAGRIGATRRLLASCAAWLLVTTVFALAAKRAESSLLAALDRDAVTDVVTTPRAANPLCYSAIGVEVTPERYRVTLATVSPLPWLIAARDCPIDRRGTTAELTPARASADHSLRWLGSFEGSRIELSRLAARCDVGAALRFLRVPFWKWMNDGKLVVGDLRYDRSERLEFAEVELAPTPICPRNVPPWLPPRHELFAHAGASAGARR